jgi:RNA polymerase sigma-70 factor (ECF subfamily)
MDGNPRRSDASEASARPAKEESSPLDTETGKGTTRDEAVTKNEKTSSRSERLSSNEASELNTDDLNFDVSMNRLPEDSSESAPDARTGGEGESEDDVGEDAAIDLPDDPLDPENDAQDAEFEAFPPEDTQLSSTEGVPEDMGTIALERLPVDRRGANQIAPPFLGGLTGELSQMTDAEIMQRAGAGDDVCFEFLVAKYRRPIIGFMYRMVHNQAVAEELAQEVFLRVYRARASYRAEARFTTWLYRIASNMAINHARDTKYERASSSVYLDQADEATGVKPDVADFHPLAEEDMLRDERMKRIREHVMALPERQRMAVVMHKYQDMDYKQIGTVLKLSESATKSLLFRAYQTLRDRLKEFA